MPVAFDEYEPDERGEIRPGTNAHAIMRFLLDHPATGFTPKEIHEAADVARGSVSTTLSRLEERGLVRHKGEYWAAETDDEIASRVGSILGMTTVSEQFSDDWYANNPDWADELPDLDKDEE
jgi:Mn-dependent DtxR family transcriptional regulator